MKETKLRKIFNFANVLLITLLCVIMVYPYLNQLATAFNDSLDTSVGGLTFYPRVFTLENFRTVFANSQVRIGLLISSSRTIIATLLSLLVTYMAAYALSNKHLKGRKGINIFTFLFLCLSFLR